LPDGLEEGVEPRPENRPAPPTGLREDTVMVRGAGYTGRPALTVHLLGAVLAGPWSELKVLPADPPSPDSFNTQHDFVIPVTGSKASTYLYAGDRHSQWTRRGPT
jgi:hypothetical protein